MTLDNPLASVLPRADLIHDRAALQAAIDQMAASLRADYGSDRPLFLTVMHGGMIFASLLALELGFDVEFDYLHATRYRGKTSGGGLQWLRHPAVPMVGATGPAGR
jgi:hypoxanthine phosphoribosyltransferase